MIEQVTAFGITFPYIWSLFAFAYGVITVLLVKSIIRWGDIFAVFSVGLFMAVPLLIATFIWRFLALEPPIVDSVALIFIVIGVFAGYGTDTLARFIVALESYNQMKRDIKEGKYQENTLPQGLYLDEENQ
jgi:ABC-type multidrug transport system fused ATPase/permease subunit